MSFRPDLPELPVTVLRRLLPHIRNADMDNVEEAFKASPALYNELSYLTKKHSRRRFAETRLICPFCLVKGNYFTKQTPWLRIQNAFYNQDYRTRKAARDCVSVKGVLNQDGSWHYKVASKTLREIQSGIVVPDGETLVEYLEPENKFRTMTSHWAESGLKKGKTVKILRMAMRKMELFGDAYGLVEHIEKHHHPNGHGWRSDNDEPVRAYEIDEISNLIMSKIFQGSLRRRTPRQNKDFHEMLVTRIINNKRRYDERKRFLNPTSAKYTDVGYTHVYMRTLATAYMVDDNLQRPTFRHKKVPAYLHKILALRDYLQCSCEIYEKLDFQELAVYDASKFGMMNAIRQICNAVVKQPY